MINTDMELFNALESIYKLAKKENDARVARNEEYLQDFGEHGFYVWGEFWEVEGTNCHTLKYGHVEEYALTHFVAATLEGDEYSHTLFAAACFNSIAGTVEDILEELQWRSENSSPTNLYPIRAERITNRYSTKLSHLEKANRIIKHLVSGMVFTEDGYENDLYENKEGAWILSPLREQEVALIKKSRSSPDGEPWVPRTLDFCVKEEVSSEDIESGLYPPNLNEVYASPLGKLAVGPERVMLASGDFEQLLNQLKNTD